MSVDKESSFVVLSNLRHELRTPINVIIGYSEMILEDLETTNHKTSLHELQQIRNCAIKLIFLIKNLLNDETLELYQLDLARLLTEQTVQVQLQTPTNLVIEYCQQILKQADDKCLISDVKKINRASHNLLAMTEDMIGISNK
ncbi:histidine kinase [Xenococcus sp. PCC 7305]|uniref:histidine kinase dimerization/phospho-acceptor domain-containing protein n=1 Tax=Xenococcus sp. PCC 7305 TaxID=102125 RepID=UPI0002AD0882|nr:histidine kinase dimerization/phospho-acceptor domain-containing protein [Xenococcus sp. PCC 7305]ELS03353.1 histidine kinase [Xenococcus sp. PCC 7305]